MLQNSYFLAKIGADTAENEQHFAEILPKTATYPTTLLLASRPDLASKLRRRPPARARRAAAAQVRSARRFQLVSELNSIDEVDCQFVP